jgi:hypothetical protein
MTIREVEQLYAEKGPLDLERDYRDLVATIQRLEIKAPIPNSDYFHGLFLTDLMFGGSSRSIRMLNGIGESNWLQVLRANLEKALGRIKERKGCLKAIFVGGGEAPSAIVHLRDRFGAETVKYMTATTAKPVRHFIACDSRMLRLEEIHDPLTSDTESDCIRATVYLSNPEKTKAVEEEFDVIWDRLAGQD